MSCAQDDELEIVEEASLTRDLRKVANTETAATGADCGERPGRGWMRGALESGSVPGWYQRLRELWDGVRSTRIV